MFEPKQLIGHTRCGRYHIRADRGQGCDGWLFVADQEPQNLCAPLSQVFGGGCDQASRGQTRVVLEVFPEGANCDLAEWQNLKSLHPHGHLLECLDVGRSQDEDLKGYPYLVTELWKQTLSQLLARQPRLEDDEIRKLAKQIAAALARYHAAERVHGDVRGERICQTTHGWMLAPAFRPQTNGQSPNKAVAIAPQDDIYALGRVLLACLSSQFASVAGSERRHPESQAEIESAIRTLPELWQTWLRRCLAAEPSRRCSAAELALMDAEVPPLAMIISVDREGDQYRVRWEPAARGSVRVYRWKSSALPRQGELWMADDLDHVAECMPATMPTEAHVQLAPQNGCQVVVVNVVDEAAIVCDGLTLSWAADVQRLTLAVEDETVIATWDWPGGSAMACVTVRLGESPTGPGDPQASTKRCFRAGYLTKKRFAIPVARRAVQVHVAVYAAYRHEEGWELASGRTQGARAVIPFVQGNGHSARMVP